MNILLFELSAFEETAPLLRVSGEKARHMLRVQCVKPGDELRVGEINGRFGRGKVLEAGRDNVLLEVRLFGETPEIPPTDLIVALPRPQILKRVLRDSASLGVRRIALIVTSRVEKSFLQSPLLEPERLNSHLLLGLEQAVHTLLPEVSIHTCFHEFIVNAIKNITSDCKALFIADPRAEHDFRSLGAPSELGRLQRAAVAIGPEAGWTTEEVEAFLANGFSPFTMGERMLRVDTAVCAVLAQLDLLRRFSRPR